MFLLILRGLLFILIFALNSTSPVFLRFNVTLSVVDDKIIALLFDKYHKFVDTFVS